MPLQWRSSPKTSASIQATGFCGGIVARAALLPPGAGRLAARAWPDVDDQSRRFGSDQPNAVVHEALVLLYAIDAIEQCLDLHLVVRPWRILVSQPSQPHPPKPKPHVGVHLRRLPSLYAPCSTTSKLIALPTIKGHRATRGPQPRVHAASSRRRPDPRPHPCFTPTDFPEDPKSLGDCSVRRSRDRRRLRRDRARMRMRWV